MGKDLSQTSEPRHPKLDGQVATQRFRAMGTTIELGVWVEAANKPPTNDQWIHIQELVETYERQFSRFRPDSDISRANQSVGQWVHVSSSTGAVLQLALEAHQASQGLYHPCLGHIMKRLGYDSSFGEMKKDIHRQIPSDVFSPKPTIAGQSTQSLFELRWVGNDVWVRVPGGRQLDLGGIAKGWIVEQMTQGLRSIGFHHFVCSAGGDMVCSGTRGGEPWRIGIVSPFDASTQALVLNVTSMAVATSGTYKRAWHVDGEPVHHIIHPHTGRPSNSDVLSCTIVTPRLTDAEWMAKTGLLLGSEAAISWFVERKIPAWVLITDKQEVITPWNLSTRNQ